MTLALLKTNLTEFYTANLRPSRDGGNNLPLDFKTLYSINEAFFHKKTNIPVNNVYVSAIATAKNVRLYKTRLYIDNQEPDIAALADSFINEWINRNLTGYHIDFFIPVCNTHMTTDPLTNESYYRFYSLSSRIEE